MEKEPLREQKKSITCESAISKPFLTSVLFIDTNTTGFMFHVWTKKKKKKNFPPDNGK